LKNSLKIVMIGPLMLAYVTYICSMFSEREKIGE